MPDTPISAARFSISIDGHEVGIFHSVDVPEAAGLTGDEAGTLKVLKAFPRVTDVTLKRGVIESRVSKIDAFTIKQKVSEGELKANPAELKASPGRTPVLLCGFKSVDGWNPALLGMKATPGEITLQDAAGHPVARWHFTNAWPSKVQFNPGAGNSDLLLLLEGLRRS